MDNKNLVDILNKSLESLKMDIQDNLRKNNRVASGKTSKSLRIKIDANANQVKGTLLGSTVLDSLEYGRGATKNAGSSASWEKELRDWMRIRGIDQGAFYPIWRKINRDGYEGTGGLVSDPVEKFKDLISSKLKIELIKDFKRNGINSNK